MNKLFLNYSNVPIETDTDIIPLLKDMSLVAITDDTYMDVKHLGGYMFSRICPAGTLLLTTEHGIYTLSLLGRLESPINNGSYIQDIELLELDPKLKRAISLLKREALRTPGQRHYVRQTGPFMGHSYFLSFPSKK